MRRPLSERNVKWNEKKHFNNLLIALIILCFSPARRIVIQHKNGSDNIDFDIGTSYTCFRSVAKMKPWYNPSCTPENQPASGDAPETTPTSRQPPANRNESSPPGQCSSEHYWPACTSLPKKTLLLSLTIQQNAGPQVSHLLRSKVLKWNWRRRGKNYFKWK